MNVYARIMRMYTICCMCRDIDDSHMVSGLHWCFVLPLQKTWLHYIDILRGLVHEETTKELPVVKTGRVHEIRK